MVELASPVTGLYIDNDLYPKAPADDPLQQYTPLPPGAGYQPPLGPNERDRWFWQQDPDRLYSTGLHRFADQASKPTWGDVEHRLADYAIRTAKGIVAAGPGTLNRLMSGEMQPGSEESKRALVDTALTYGALGTVVPRPAGSLGLFGGMRSHTAPRLDNLPPEGSSLRSVEAAQRMESGQWPFNRPHNRDEIFNETGLFKTPDGEWRYIISDKGAELNTANLDSHSYTDSAGNQQEAFGFHYGKNMKLGDVLKHDELYQAYPWARDIKVEAIDPERARQGSWILGGYNRADNTLRLQMMGKEDLTRMTLHEVQHAIQGREGFARGGSSAEFLPPRFRENFEELEKVIYSIKDHVAKGHTPSEKLKNDFATAVRLRNDMADKINEAIDKYYKLGGEVESRAAEAMYHLRRWDMPPWEAGEFFSETGGGGRMAEYTPFEQQNVQRRDIILDPTDHPDGTRLTIDEPPRSSSVEEPIKLDDVRARKAAEQDAKLQEQVRAKLEEMRERLLDKPSYPLPDPVKEALQYFDMLGYETNREAIGALRQSGPKWQEHHDMRSNADAGARMNDLERHQDTLKHRKHISVLGKYLSRPPGGWPEGTPFP